MPLPTPIQLKVDLGGRSVTITCDDPRFRLIDGVYQPGSDNGADLQGSLRFKVQDPMNQSRSGNQLTMSSGPLDALVAWERIDGFLYSPEIVEDDFYIVAKLLRSAIGVGRRRFKLQETGALPVIGLPHHPPPSIPPRPTDQHAK